MKNEKKELFEMKICYDKNNNLIQCIFNKPFDFNIILNKKDLIELKSFYPCTSIDLSYLNLNDDDINFLNYENLSSLKTLDLSNTGISSLNFVSFKSLVNLESINLSNNKIEDISPLTIENIAFNRPEPITVITMENNPIKKGLHVLKGEFFSRCFYSKIYDIQKINNEYKISVEFHFFSINCLIIKMNNLIKMMLLSIFQIFIMILNITVLVILLIYILII